MKILCLPVPSLASSIQRVNWVAQVVVTKEGQRRIVRHWSCAQLLFTQRLSCSLKLFGTTSFDALPQCVFQTAEYLIDMFLHACPL